MCKLGSQKNGTWNACKNDIQSQTWKSAAGVLWKEREISSCEWGCIQCGLHTVKARYEYKKMKFFIFSALLITSILLNIWKYIFDVIYVLLTTNSKLMPAEASEAVIMCFLTIGITVSCSLSPDTVLYTVYATRFIKRETVTGRNKKNEIFRNSGKRKGRICNVCTCKIKIL